MNKTSRLYVQGFLTMEAGVKVQKDKINCYGQ